MPEVHTETKWLHDTVPSWVKWSVSPGASPGRRDCIHGPIHGFARTEKTRRLLTLGGIVGAQSHIHSSVLLDDDRGTHSPGRLRYPGPWCALAREAFGV